MPLISIFLMMSDVDHLSMYLLAVCLSFLEKCLSSLLPILFYKYVVCFFVIELYVFPMYFRYVLLLSHFSRVRLCNPIDSSPPGSPVPGILQARILEWVAISFSAVSPYLMSIWM